MDIFSLGCLLHYVMGDGKHPYGDTTHKRRTNILENKPTLLENIEDGPNLSGKAVLALIKSMIEDSPEMRPKTEKIHDFFNAGNAKMTGAPHGQIDHGVSPSTSFGTPHSTSATGTGNEFVKEMWSVFLL